MVVSLKESVLHVILFTLYANELLLVVFTRIGDYSVVVCKEKRDEAIFQLLIYNCV